MKTYKISVVVTQYGEIEVEADSKGEALDKAQDELYDGCSVHVYNEEAEALEVIE